MSERTNLEMVFFDAAGTLFEVRGSVGEIYARVARRYGIEAAPAEIERGFVRHFHHQPPMAFPPETPEIERLALEREWWRRLVRAVFADGGPFPRFDDYFAEIFELFRGREGWAVYPDVEPALATLNAQVISVHPVEVAVVR
jgi:putative hydrolase of the HAD superfamily